MGLEDQGRIREVADRYPGEIVVLLGSPDAETAELYAETMTHGDPTYAGVLAGVALGLPVYFIAEDDIKAQIPPDVYDEQVSIMEMALPTVDICEKVRAVRTKERV
jgi:hypothetical protein